MRTTRMNDGTTPMPPEAVKKIIDENVPEDMRDYAYKIARVESNFNPAASRSNGKGATFDVCYSTNRAQVPHD
jgi:hypothetical protein